MVAINIGIMPKPFCSTHNISTFSSTKIKCFTDNDLITKQGNNLLQNAVGVIKCVVLTIKGDKYYKMRRLLQQTAQQNLGVTSTLG